MPDMVLPAEGGCRCGRIRFRVTKPALLTMVCHCRGCQRMSASAFSTSIAVPSDGFEVIAGEPVIGGLHGPESRHQHCDHCKSWVFTRALPELGFVNVRATLLDDAGWFFPFVETYTSEALPWAKTPARYRFERFPEMDEYGPIAQEFAAR
jgi:hypothetical protein